MGKLNQEAQTKLVRILSMGRGRLDYAKQLVVDDLPDKPPSPPRDLP